MARTRLIGLALAIGGSTVTGTAYYLIPYNVGFPAVVLAVPLVATVAGLFQVICGFTLLEANATLPSLPIWKKTVIVMLALLLLVVALLAFAIFIGEVEQAL